MSDHVRRPTDAVKIDQQPTREAVGIAISRVRRGPQDGQIYFVYEGRVVADVQIHLYDPNAVMGLAGSIGQQIVELFPVQAPEEPPKPSLVRVGEGALADLPPIRRQ